MKKIKLPKSTTILLGSLGAFWVANIIHLSFYIIGIMILLLIPVFIFEFLYPKSELDGITESTEHTTTEEEASEETDSGTLVEQE